MSEYHVQCQFVRGNERYTAWIPEEYAKLGRVLKLRHDDGHWEDGWEVKRRGARMLSSYVEDHERNYLKQREASDI